MQTIVINTLTRFKRNICKTFMNYLFDIRYTYVRLTIMKVILRTVQVTNCPSEILDFLRPHAQRAGVGDSDAAVCRYALAELFRRVTGESVEAKASVHRD